MPLAVTGASQWGVVVPVEKTNLLSNPSFEKGTAGWGTLQAGTIGTTSQFQQFGAWSGSIAPTSNGTTGAISPTFSAGNGTDYYFSAYVRGANGIPYKLGVGDSNGVNLVGSTNFTGGGTWQRVVGSWTESVGATRRLVLQKAGNADTSAVYIDGVQIEPGSVTTYIDGDQDGCNWISVPHASTSFRSGQSRSGGSVIALGDLGLAVNDSLGIGMPPTENSAQSYAILDGAQYQRTRYGARAFTLTGKPIHGTTRQDFHALRQRLVDAFQIDTVTPQQPTRFVYVGGLGTMQIDAYYESGLEMNQTDGPMAEAVALKFVAEEPAWHAPTQEGTSLAPRVALGSTNFLAQRDPLGRWGTLGIAGTTVNNTVRCLAYGSTDGLIWAGGDFGSAGGTACLALTTYNPTTQRFGTVLAGTLSAAPTHIYSLVFNPGGTLFLGGEFHSVNGTQAQYVAQMVNNAYGTLSGGTVDNIVDELLFTATGTLLAAGLFAQAGGTRAVSVAMYTGAWGTLGPGSVTGEVRALAYAPQGSGTVYLGGDIVTLGGTAANCVGFWSRNGFGTLLTGMTGGAGTHVYDLLRAPNGTLIAVGQFGNAGGATAINIASWNGVAWSGMGTVYGTAAEVRYITRLNDRTLITGNFPSAGAFPTPDNAAYVGAGGNFLPIDIDLPASGTVFSAITTPSGTQYWAGTFSGTAQAASVAQIVNTGRAPAYPTVWMRNTSTGTARVYSLTNTTTNTTIAFNLSLLPSEEATLVLTPGNRTFTSSFRENIFDALIPGSNLTAWNLLPGTNVVSFFGDNDSLITSFYWQPRSMSADGGTIY